MLTTDSSSYYMKYAKKKATKEVRGVLLCTHPLVAIPAGGELCPWRSCRDLWWCIPSQLALAGVLEPRRLMTDRSAYLSYLEVQLERVSAACLHASASRYFGRVLLRLLAQHAAPPSAHLSRLCWRLVWPLVLVWMTFTRNLLVWMPRLVAQWFGHCPHAKLVGTRV